MLFTKAMSVNEVEKEKGLEVWKSMSHGSFWLENGKMGILRDESRLVIFKEL